MSDPHDPWVTAFRASMLMSSGAIEASVAAADAAAWQHRPAALLIERGVWIALQQDSPLYRINHTTPNGIKHMRHEVSAGYPRKVVDDD